MDNKIKFRGRWCGSGKPVYSSPVMEKDSETLPLSEFFKQWEMGCIENVVQYTGLNDKNGTPIFDGDYVQYYPYNNLGYKSVYYKGYVEWGQTGDSDGYAHGKHYEYTVRGDSLADIADGDYSGFEITVIEINKQGED